MASDFGYPEYMFDKTDYLIIQNFFEEKKELFQQKKLIIFGAGIRGTIFGKWITNFGIESYDFCDNNSQKWGGTIGGHHIMSLDELRENIEEKVVLVSVESKDLAAEIEKQMIEYGFEKNNNLFSLPTEIYDNYLNKFFEPIQNHLLVLGDCRFTFTSFTDDNLQTLDDILEENLRENGIKAKILSMHALSMRAQYYVVKTQLSIGNKPSAIMLPINYETYNGTMHLLSSSQHAELMRRIYEQAEMEDEEFEEYVKLTKERTLNPPFIFSTEDGVGIEGISDKKLRLFLKMSYMYEPDNNSEGVVYLKKFLELAKQEKIKVYAFVPPLNYMSGKEYWGDAFIDSYKKGVNFFEQILKSYGCCFLDQSFLLTEEGFYSKYDKNEIANYEGRMQMASSLLEFFKEHELNEN